ncbi:MAG: hypothetical protein WBA31_00925, partial [Candidatus Dormiibacterota bacterium]
MFNTLPRVRRDFDAQSGRRPTSPIWLAYGLMFLLLIAYAISVVVRNYGYSMPLDGWAVDGFEFLACGLCLRLALGRRRDRIIPLLLGCALVCWTLGDTVLTALTHFEGNNVPSPSWADACYLCFYPLAYFGLVLIMRREVKQLVPATWLDGLVAGIGAAAICACFVFQPTILHALGGNSLAVAVNLAYPVGDLLLLALVIGGTATFPGRPKPQWVVLALACVAIAVGDSFNLLALHGTSTAVGNLANAIAWPSAILLVSASMWMRSGPTNLLLLQRAPGFLLPGAAAFGALIILLINTLHPLTQVAVYLALATLVIAGIRAGLSAVSLRRLTDERHRQSVTDHLTDLGNRRRLFALLDAYFADRSDPRTPDR